jgi:tetratricopeptide (TPR) repeat protein
MVVNYRKNIQMKFIPLIIALLFYGHLPVNGQGNTDSLKKIVKRGSDCSAEDACMSKKIRYIKACGALGDYYYNKKDNKSALQYYLLAADLTDGVDSDLGEDMTAIGMRNKICIKAGDIYFKGIGVRKDHDKALHYHAKALFFSPTFPKKYSYQYFHDAALLFTADSTKDSIVYVINPFLSNRNSDKKLLKNYFAGILNALHTDSTLKATIAYSITYSMKGEAVMYNVLEPFWNLVNTNDGRNKIELANENIEKEFHGLKKMWCIKIMLHH